VPRDASFAPSQRQALARPAVRGLWPLDFDESLLILSDVHLGNDLNDLTATPARRSHQVDVDLANLVDHYRRTRPSGRRWRLVVAGDFVDFIGIAIRPPEGGNDLDTAPSSEERAHGLGNAADHARLKLRAVVARHRVVFEAIAAFVADGHALTIVHGNHDVEFYWETAQEELRRALVALAAERAGGRGEALAGFAARVEFAPWFYYVSGVAYVEHGHQYDTLCSTDHVMAPLSPRDPRRIARSFSDVLLRWVVRPTSGVPEYGHERMGIGDYVMLGVRMGAGGLVRLAGRFASAVVELFRLHRAHLSEATVALREEHERRMAALADATRVGLERLRALAALQAPPVTRSVQKILASVLLDKLALLLAAWTLAGAVLLVGGRGPWSVAGLGAVAGLWWWAHGALTERRRAWFGEKLDNDEALLERAGHLARLFPAAFVVMGHTHTPVVRPVAEGAATYVNVGSWHEAESDGRSRYRAARTHLVIHPAEQGATAEFLSWGEQGPETYRDS
jgi:UDP-2,3-diacylglucosamine pyrophosphatase LpxH